MEAKLTEMHSSDIITDKIVKVLRGTLGNPKAYIHHLRVLETMRNIVHNRIESDGEFDSKHELYPLFNTLNELYGSLWDRDVYRECRQINSAIESDNQGRDAL